MPRRRLRRQALLTAGSRHRVRPRRTTSRIPSRVTQIMRLLWLCNSRTKKTSALVRDRVQRQPKPRTAIAIAVTITTPAPTTTPAAATPPSLGPSAFGTVPAPQPETRAPGAGGVAAPQNPPHRRSSSPLTSQQQQQQQQQRIRPLISTETTAVDDPDAPPPTYEQAAKTPVYVPPEGHPQHPGPFSDQLTGVTSASSAASASSSGVAGPRSSSYGFSGSNSNMNVGRRGPQHISQRGRQNYPPQNQHQHQHPYGTPTTLAERGREKKDCIVM